MLDLRRLRLLSELARRETIAEVARVLGYTPSAVSQSLIQLEREVGVQLLERDGRRVRLTPAARGLVARTDRALSELDIAEAELAAEHQTVRGPVVVGAFASAAVALVIPALVELSRQHAELVCSVSEYEPEDGIALLRSGDLDVLVSERNDDVEPPPAGGLAAHPLMSEPLRLVLPADAPEQPAPVALADFSERPWIAGPAGSQYEAVLQRACRSAGFAPRIAHRADEALVIQSLVASGLGVALLPTLACSDPFGLRYASVLPAPPSRHVFTFVRRGAEMRPAIAATLAALQHQAAQRNH